MIGEQDHDRVVGDSDLVEHIEKPGDPVLDLPNRAVILVHGGAILRRHGLARPPELAGHASLVGGRPSPVMAYLGPCWTTWLKRFGEGLLQAHQFALYEGRWKLIRYGRSEDGGWFDVELYDIHDDAGEQRDLSERYPAVVADMTRDLERTLTRHPPLYTFGAPPAPDLREGTYCPGGGAPARLRAAHVLR